jgi:hypothetical protein
MSGPSQNEIHSEMTFFFRAVQRAQLRSHGHAWTGQAFGCSAALGAGRRPRARTGLSSRVAVVLARTREGRRVSAARRGRGRGRSAARRELARLHGPSCTGGRRPRRAAPTPRVARPGATVRRARRASLAAALGAARADGAGRRPGWRGSTSPFQARAGRRRAASAPPTARAGALLLVRVASCARGRVLGGRLAGCTRWQLGGGRLSPGGRCRAAAILGAAELRRGGVRPSSALASACSGGARRVGRRACAGGGACCAQEVAAPSRPMGAGWLGEGAGFSLAVNS